MVATELERFDPTQFDRTVFDPMQLENLDSGELRDLNKPLEALENQKLESQKEW